MNSLTRTLLVPAAGWGMALAVALGGGGEAGDGIGRHRGLRDGPCPQSSLGGFDAFARNGLDARDGVEWHAPNGGVLYAGNKESRKVANPASPAKKA